jgi:hypothetical protein
MSAVAAAGLPALPACPECREPVPDLTPDHFVRCGRCGTHLTGSVFPAVSLLREQPIQTGERAVEGDAVCFFHPGKRAEHSCARCGRFICGLCDMPIGKEHICPTCLGSGLESGKLEELTPRRIVWGQLAMITGGLPLLMFFFMWPFFVITGPAAVGVAIYGWNKPGSLVKGRRRVAASLGLILGLAQIAIFVAMAIFIRQSINSQ